MRRKFAAVGLVGAILFALVGVVASPHASAEQIGNDDTAFRDSFQDPNETVIELTDNLTLTCALAAAPTRTSANAMVIDGTGHTITQGCANRPVLNVSGNGLLTLRNVTITGGSIGGINAGAGGLTVEDSTLTANTGGGTIDSQGPVQLTRSSITNGAYAIEGSSTVSLTQSTIAFNTVPQNIGVEAVVSSPSTILLSNSTVTNNSAAQGAIYGNTVSLQFATVVENTATGNNEGANINTGLQGSFSSFASVVAMPVGGPNCSFDFPNHFSSGFNWSDDTSCFFTAGSDFQQLGANPMLDQLASNGGPTQTRSPQPGSPLIDRPNFNCAQQNLARFGPTPQVAVPPPPPVDQRGVSRPQGATCDTGAVEFTPTNPTGKPTITVTAVPAIAIEGGADGGFVFHRAGSTAGALSVSIQAGGTATSGTDYTALGNVTMPAGQTDVFVPVHALADNVADDGETVIAQVVGGANYSVGSPSTATVTIKEHGFCDSAPQAPYTDRDAFDVHARAIDCITAYHMAEGFDDGSYGPTLPVIRAQMASFVARLMNQAGVTLPTDPPDAFPGDDGSVHELAINQLAVLGIFDETTGQTGDKYNVSDPMKREDMAQILFNAYTVITGGSLPEGPDAFTDDNTSDNQAAINSLAQVGVVEGTGGGLYDPAGSVSRAQMASFFVRYMQLLVGAGKLAPLP